MVVLAVSIPTLVGSICSTLAASFIFACYIALPQKTHFRHVLILNLATADLINGLNNSISGIYALAVGDIPAGPACTVNGFIGQLSVQGTDFSILLIAIITVAVLKSSKSLPDASLRSQILLSSMVWIMPVISSSTGLALGAYAPVSGNWCWLSVDRQDLRYALGHSWRLAIIIVTISLYTYLFIYFRQVFRKTSQLSMTSIQTMTAPVNHLQLYNSESPAVFKQIQVSQKFTNAEQTIKTSWEENRKRPDSGNSSSDYGDSSDLNRPPTPPSFESRDILAMSTTSLSPYHASQDFAQPTREYCYFTKPCTTTITSVAHTNNPTSNLDSISKQRSKQIQRALLLNAYPIAYVILWLPGLINRFVELSGRKSFTLTVLQSSTQFVGVANAVTYGFNEKVREQVGSWWRGHSHSINK